MARRKTGGCKRGTPNEATARMREARAANKITVQMGGTSAETAQEFAGEALATLVEVTRDNRSSPAKRSRPWSRLCVTMPPKKRALPHQATAGGAGVCLQSVGPVELPSDAMPRATTVEDDPFGPGQL
jgi:hypothetical protein